MLVHAIVGNSRRRYLTRSHVQREFPYGGSIIYQLLQNIVQKIRHDDPADRAVVNLLVTFEEYLIKTRAMDSDFVMFFARNRKV